MKIHIHKKEKGFSMIEVITAMGIFGIAILSLAAFFAISSRTIRTARNMTTATNLAQEAADEKISLAYDSLTPGAETRTRFSSDESSPFYDFEKQINISLIDQNLSSSVTDVGLKKVDCAVYWQEGTDEKSLQISTIISQK
jgi:prepilin-type N-terminal cleavage/methylation domain-containing protein